MIAALKNVCRQLAAAVCEQVSLSQGRGLSTYSNRNSVPGHLVVAGVMDVDLLRTAQSILHGCRSMLMKITIHYQ